jgi:hypothetical protein
LTANSLNSDMKLMTRVSLWLDDVRVAREF